MADNTNGLWSGITRPHFPNLFLFPVFTVCIWSRQQSLSDNMVRLLHSQWRWLAGRGRAQESRDCEIFIATRSLTAPRGRMFSVNSHSELPASPSIFCSEQSPPPTFVTLPTPPPPPPEWSAPHSYSPYPR